MAATNTYALITGASSGFGYEFAKILAQKGYNLAIVARSGEQLNEIAQRLQQQFDIDCKVLTKDLFDRDAPRQVYDELKSQGCEVEILVNNAGAGEYGNFRESDLERELDIIQLNTQAVVSFTKLYLRDFLERGRGRILQVASVASFAPMPFMAVYAATKAFVLSFSEAIQSEIRDLGQDVHVTILCPGASDTNFFVRAGAEDSGYAKQPMSDPHTVAEEGINALFRGEARHVVGLMNKVQVAAARLMPDELLASTFKQMGK